MIRVSTIKKTKTIPDYQVNIILDLTTINNSIYAADTWHACWASRPQRQLCPDKRVGRMYESVADDNDMNTK